MQVLIDFGLAYVTTRSAVAACEDRAVDLYVLERAIVSMHCDCGDVLVRARARSGGMRACVHNSLASLQSLSQFEAVLESYLADVASSAAMSTRFQQVRQRGRKRLAFG